VEEGVASGAGGRGMMLSFTTCAVLNRLPVRNWWHTAQLCLCLLWCLVSGPLVTMEVNRPFMTAETSMGTIMA
jgi:hypothetical protein